MSSNPEFSKIVLIYNPKSTGDAKAKAIALQSKLVKLYGNNKVSLRPTDHAGHAKKIAQEIIQQEIQPLLISVSGDGGYHEVINGVLSANKEKIRGDSIVAVEAAGNANDHYRHIRNNDTLLDAIQHCKLKHLELIKIVVQRGSQHTTIYAHSYCGLGLTPKAGHQLNKEVLNPVKEKVIIAKELINFEPINVQIEGTQLLIGNIIIAKIGRMSKVLKLHKTESAPPEGMLRLLIDTKPTRSSIVRKIIRGVTTGLDKDCKLVRSFACTVLEDTMMQLDGEIYPLMKGDTIKVSVSKNRLRTL